MLKNIGIEKYLLTDFEADMAILFNSEWYMSFTSGHTPPEPIDKLSSREIALLKAQIEKVLRLIKKEDK